MKQISKHSLSIGVIDNYKNDEDAEFAIIRLNFLSDGFNTHELPFTLDLLQKYAPTILGKFIVAKYNRYTQDVEGHEDEETIVGYVPKTAQISYEKTANGTFACVDGVISKLYATNVYEMYKKNNHRSVSVEIETEWDSGIPDEGNLIGFNITGVTLLGLDYRPSCTLATSKIVKFSAQEADEFYQQECVLSTYIKERNKKMAEGKTYKVNTTELKDTPWGDIDKTKLRNTIMEASNKNSLVHKVYAIVDSGWEEAPSEKLKYPLMELKDDTFYYNRGALASALGYAKAQNESTVVSKVEELYKKFNLDKDESKGGNKEMAIEGREAWGEVIRKVQEHEGKGAYVDSVEKDHIIYTKDNVRYHVDADIEIGKDDKTVHASIKWDTVKKDADQKMEAAVEECAQDNLENPGFKIGKEETTLENKETCANENEACCDNLSVEELAKKVKEQQNIIMQYETELEELRAFKTQTQENHQKLTVDKVLASVRSDIDDNSFKKLQEEGMKCKFEELSIWENKVKATAYEMSIQKPKSRGDVWSMAGDSSHTQKAVVDLWD